MAILDLIEFHDPTGGQILQLVMRDGTGELRLGSQIVVFDTHKVVFFHNNKALDMLEPGEHTLSAASIPLLANEIGLADDSRLLFRSDLYFVSVYDFVDHKWGASKPLPFHDPVSGPASLRCFGAYSFAVSDPLKFVNKVVGEIGLHTTIEVSDYLNAAILTCLSDILANTTLALSEQSQQSGALAKLLQQSIADSFSDLGLTLKQFNIQAMAVLTHIL